MTADGHNDEPLDNFDEGHAVPSRTNRTAIVAAAVVVGLLVVGFAVTRDADDAASTAQTVACDPSGGSDGTALAGGLVPEARPDALPPGILCAFASDEGVDVADWLGGAPLVINFWATWCAPCVAEMPDFQQIHENAAGDFRLIGVNTQDSPVLARDFVDELGITYDLVRDPDGEYFTANSGFGMPTTLFVAPDGEIRYRQTGPLTLEQMADLLREHLGVDVAAAVLPE